MTTGRLDGAPADVVRAGQAEATRGRPWRWQHYLASVGVLFLLWGAWTIVAWLSVGPQPVTRYRDPESTAYWLAKGYEVVGVLLIVGVGGWVVRGCLRERRITFDAQMCIAGALAYWLDPFYNFFVPTNLYSSNFINMGSWCSYAPFVVNKACSGSPEPLLVIGAIYVVGFLVCAILGSAIIRTLKSRRPGSTMAQALILLAVFAIVADLLIDGVASQVHLWNLFIAEGIDIGGAGRPFPATLPLSAIIFFGAPTLARYLRDDRGRTIFERGLDHLPARRRSLLGFLALAGYMQVMAFVTIVITIAPLGFYANNSPQYPPYILNGQCDVGSATGSAYGPCPGTPGFKAPIRHLPNR